VRLTPFIFTRSVYDHGEPGTSMYWYNVIMIDSSHNHNQLDHLLSNYCEMYAGNIPSLLVLPRLSKKKKAKERNIYLHCYKCKVVRITSGEPGI
jgi:hypothetical protein